MPRDELKVNITIKGTRIFLAAQATDCDPKMTTLEGNLQTALERVPSFVEEANRQWDTAPRNPKSTIPEPVAPAAIKTPAARKTATPAAAKPSQPAMKPMF